MNANLEGMRHREIEFVPDRLIADPIVFLGMTDREIVTLGLLGIVLFIPLWVLLLLPWGLGAFGLGVGMLSALLSLWVVSKWLLRIKTRLPNGLHLVWIRRRAQDLGLIRCGYITRSGAWDIRRTVLVHKHAPDDR